MKRFFFSTYLFIILAVIATLWGVGYLTDLYVQYRYPNVIVQDDQNLSRGTYYLLEKELLAVDENQFPTILEKLQPHFGYPLTIERIDSLSFTSSQRESLHEGSIVLIEDGDIHWKRIGESDYALSMGPFKYLEFKATEITGIFVVSALLLGLLILCWTIYFWRRLNKLREATHAFGEGEFSTRMAVPRFSSLSSIAKTFNSMAEHIERLLSSHKQLVNAVSHELRTPISRIRFGLESLRRAEEEDRIKQLSGLRRDVDELDGLVSEMLSYARFERMETQINSQSLRILPWLREYMTVANELSKVPLEFSFKNIAESYEFNFDPRQLERAIHNLLQNGSRFASKIMIVRLIKETEAIIISVEDDGPGIDPEDRERIFDPFVRLDSSRNRENGGYGLGLSIVRQIVRAHGGSVTVENSSMGGAVFSLKLPAK